MIALARLACDVPDDVDDLPVFYAIRALLDRHAQLRANAPADRSSRAILQLAAAAAMSPDVPVPHGD